MIGSEKKKVMILWLALFRVQEKEPILKACIFKMTQNQYIS